MNEPNEVTEHIYRNRLNALVSENPSYLIVGVITLIFILYLFVLQLGTYALRDIKETVQGFMSFPSEQKEAPPTPDLSDKLSDASINYITPNPSPGTISEDIARDTQGQISAISSTQVTYAQNKYVVAKGDTLASIALSVYGDSNAWVRIAKANGLTSPDSIEVGMELSIPR